jgi:hypothetical protein
MGIDDNTELTRINLSPYDKKEAEAVSLLSILSVRGDKSLIVGLVVPIGMPRYGKGIDAIEHCICVDRNLSFILRDVDRDE